VDTSLTAHRFAAHSEAVAAAAEELLGDRSLGGEDPVDVVGVLGEFVVGSPPGAVVDRAELEAQPASAVGQVHVDRVARSGAQVPCLHLAAQFPLAEQTLHAPLDEEVVGARLAVVLSVTDRCGPVVGEVAHLGGVAAVAQLATAAAELQTTPVGVVGVGLTPSVQFPSLHRQDHRMIRVLVTDHGCLHETVVEHGTSQENTRERAVPNRARRASTSPV
jgi:hypothetical protein